MRQVRSFPLQERFIEGLIQSDFVAIDTLWEKLDALHFEGDLLDAEIASAYVLRAVHRLSPPRFLQGERPSPIECQSPSPLLKFVAQYRFRRVEEVIARALVRWGNGERNVELMRSVPTALALLNLQASGRRCVSLLPDGAPTAPHEDTLAFAMHDLCHLEKFVDTDHHTGQVGLFKLLDRTFSTPEWQAFESRFDMTWLRERDAVVADMNGSAIFLFSALKMKLKMASRRQVARMRGADTTAISGPLDEVESRVFASNLDEMIELIQVDPAVRNAARVVSTRRDAPDAAVELLAYFERLGASAGVTTELVPVVAPLRKEQSPLQPTH